MITSPKVNRIFNQPWLKTGFASTGDSIEAGGQEDKTTHFDKFCQFTGQAFWHRANWCVGGKTALEVEQEQMPSVLDMLPLPANVGLFFGSNCIGDMNTLRDNFASLVRQADVYAAHGIMPWLCFIAARGSQQQDQDRWNMWNAKVAVFAAERGYKIYNVGGGVIDPYTGINLAGSTVSGSDLDHFNHWGRALIGQYNMSSNGSWLGAQRDPMPRLARDDEDSTNLFPFGCFTVDDSGHAVGGALTGATASMINDPVIHGRWQRVTRSAGSTVATKLEVGLNRDVVPGHILEFAGRFQMRGDHTQPGIWNSGIALYWGNADYGFVKNEFILGKPGLDDEAGIFRVRTAVPAGAAKCVVLIGDSDGTVAPSRDCWIQVAQVTVTDITAVEQA